MRKKIKILFDRPFFCSFILIFSYFAYISVFSSVSITDIVNDLSLIIVNYKFLFLKYFTAKNHNIVHFINVTLITFLYVFIQNKIMSPKFKIKLTLGYTVSFFLIFILFASNQYFETVKGSIYWTLFATEKPVDFTIITLRNWLTMFLNSYISIFILNHVIYFLIKRPISLLIKYFANKFKVVAFNGMDINKI